MMNRKNLLRAGLVACVALCLAGSVEKRNASPEDIAQSVLACLKENSASSPGFAPLAFEGETAVYVAFREQGKRVYSVWRTSKDWHSGLLAAIGAGKLPPASKVDTLEICLAGKPQPVAPSDEKHLLANIHRGVLGLSLRSGHDSRRFSPTAMIASNLSFKGAVQLFCKSNKVPAESVEVAVFPAHQFLVTLTPAPKAVCMLRGNSLVKPSDVGHETLRKTAENMGTWMKKQVRADGRMTYEYRPSKEKESKSNNIIRQFMSTYALERWSRFSGDARAAEAGTRNLRYNLGKFYREEGDLGFVEESGAVKLGAVAGAGLAILESPERAQYAVQEKRLGAMIGHLWKPDGSFETFYRGKPEGFDGTNFYPGEALLFWATLLEEHPDPDLMSRFMKSFRYYRTWHKQTLNPAFVPWHTKAYAKVWRITKDPELMAFILEMNDWLLSGQEWESAPYPDMRGRFAGSNNPHFGSAHSSSTGVYLEGLVEAFTVAREGGDAARMEAYRVAILRGLRSVVQLQFQDGVDMYYVSKRDSVFGGIRATEYDNEIRVDNIQHNLLAATGTLEAFGAGDYGIANPKTPAERAK